jgi:hypothetical protein
MAVVACGYSVISVVHTVSRSRATTSGNLTSRRSLNPDYRLWAVQYGPVTDSVRQLLEAHALAHGVLILTGAEELEDSGQLPPRRAGSG